MKIEIPNTGLNLSKVAACAFAVATLALSSIAQADVTIYTDRPSVRVQSVASDFTAMTGEKVSIVELAYPKIMERLKLEGATSPVDVLFVKDIVYLAELANDGYLQPMISPALVADVSPTMRDPKNLWTAVTTRGRTIVYDSSRVKATELSSYEDLTTAKWAGRLCLRTSNSAYSEALVGGLIETRGAVTAKLIVEGWIANLAVDPLAGDTAVLEAIANGVCDVGITNTYYLGQMLAKNPAFPVRAHFVDQAVSGPGGGVLGNGTGAGVAATSKQSVLATKFIELLLTDKFQLELSSANFDYPAKLGLLPGTLVKDWGTIRFNDASWSAVGSRASEAKALMQAAGYK
jgi:iron(III) transport system substrate-binding protein